MSNQQQKGFETYRADLLTMCAGKDPDGSVLMMTVRPDNRFLWPCNMTFTREQAVRMRLMLTEILDDPNSWLHTPKEDQQKIEQELRELTNQWWLPPEGNTSTQ